MAKYVGYVVKVKKAFPHPNADKLKLVQFFGETAIITRDIEDGALGIYFPAGVQLSAEFCEANHLCRTHVDGSPDTGYMDTDKRNVCAIRLRQIKSDGLWLPVESLVSFGDFTTLQEGDVIDVFNGHDICHKYVPVRQKSTKTSEPHIKKKKVCDILYFEEHVDTEQLAYNLGDIHPGDEYEITLKMDGTSQRTGYLPVFKGYKFNFFKWLFKHELEPIYEYKYVHGTRRTVMGSWEGGFYGSNEFRRKAGEFFEGKLMRGEEIYYEVVGYANNQYPIMGACPVKDPELKRQYGEAMVFDYGCDIGDNDFYVYRMTYTNDDGYTIEYTPDQMRMRCEQMGAKTVPVFARGFIPNDLRSTDYYVDGNGRFDGFVYAASAGEWLKDVAERYYDGPDPIGNTHIREGVVVRIVNKPKFTAYKHKNWSYKLIRGMVKPNDGMTDEMLEEL